MLRKKQFYLSIALILGIVIFVNIISDQYFFRLDFTEDQQYTLSDATMNILDNLEKPVTITAYFSKDLPPRVEKTRRDFKDMLVEYANRSHGKVVYQFINPNEDKEKERKAQQAGISPVMINVRKKDQMQQQKAYLGAVIKMGDQQEVIPFIKPGAAMEYSLSSNIKKVSAEHKPEVAILQGNGEPGQQYLQQAMEGLSVLYTPRFVNLTDTTALDHYKAVVLLGVSDSLSAGKLNALNNYLQRGGHLLIGLNAVQGDLQHAVGQKVATNLKHWLSTKGILVNNDFVIDAKCAAITVQQQQGSFRFASNVSFPFLPVVNHFADHAITSGLEGVIFPFVSPISFQGDSTVHYTPLVFSSDKSGEIPAPTYFNIQKHWKETDFPDQRLVLGAAFSGQGLGNAQSRMVVIGDGDFAKSQKPGGKVQEDNVNLFVNAVDWLSDDTGLIALRTKGITDRPLDEVSDAKKAVIKYVNFLLPIFLILLVGAIRSQRRRALRTKRMEEHYG